MVTTMPSIQSQSSPALEYQLKAVFLYNFTHFVDWPADAFDSQYSPFVIGIVGNDPFRSYLDEAVANERLGSHIIRVERYANVQDIKPCHILFIGSNDPDEVRQILKKVSGKRVLTVGDSPNFAKWGGMIRFYTEASKIRLHINNSVAKSEKLKISSKLLRVAQVI